MHLSSIDLTKIVKKPGSEMQMITTGWGDVTKQKQGHENKPFQLLVPCSAPLTAAMIKGVSH